MSQFTNIDIGLMVFYIMLGVFAIFFYSSYKDVLRSK